MNQLTQLNRWLGLQEPLHDHAAKADVVRAACAQGLAGLVLARRGGAEFDEPSRRILQAGAARVAAENLHAMNELSRVVETFAVRRIPLLLLKGAALNLGVYPSLDLRPMSDLDLLVAPQDAARALHVLRWIGYVDGAPLLRDDFFPSHYYEREMLLPGARPVRIDLHAHPLRPMHLAQVISRDAFWAGAQTVALRNQRVQVPSPETMFLHLAAHAAFHGCSRLIWLMDLKYLVEHHGGRLDWDRVLQSAKDWRIAWAVLRAVDTAREMVGLECPQEFLEGLVAVRPAWRDRLTLWHTPRDAASPLLHVACNLASLRGLRARVAYASALVLPGRRHLAELYPLRHRGWMVCAHVARIGRAVLRALAIPFRGLKGIFSQPQPGGAAC